MLNWQQVCDLANNKAKELNLEGEYLDRLKFEFKEIEKQGANSVWCNLYNENYKYKTNKNGLVLPWILGLTDVDPLTSKHQIIQQTDVPDIDFDCVPEAREHIKEYAAKKYGSEYTCSVGTWMTYKFKMALKDVFRAYGATNEQSKEVNEITTTLPDDVDELKDGGFSSCSGCKTKHNSTVCPKCGSEDTDDITFGKMLAEYDYFNEFYKKNTDYVDMAVRLVGKIKSLGKHAGGLIISSKPLFGNIPMAKSKGQWSSLWTEGRNTQLSKLGFVKWDVLGLKTLGYISDCCKLIEKTRGYKFDILPWLRQDKNNNIIGRYEDDKGATHEIRMDDKEVIQMINDLRTETVFQFETDVQRGILSNKVKDYYDLQVFNAMGHPGPMAMIPDYAKRRDDLSKSWVSEEHPEMAELFAETYGIIVYQEQLQAAWQKFADFTEPEAEAARKAVAKKWKDKLKPVEAQWMIGATRILGKKWAEFYWKRFVSFGRYAFNRSHSTSYIMIAWFTAWFKVHFAPEWWASVLSKCDPKPRAKYMNVARSEGINFGNINVESMSAKFSVDPTTLSITPGLLGMKGLGEKSLAKVQMEGKYSNIDEFIAANGRSKILMQRLILLGAFKKYHNNVKATWMWYLYNYAGSDEETKKIREYVKEKLSISDEENQKLKEIQIAAFKKEYPKRKIPNKILNYRKKIDDDRESVMALFPDDYTNEDILRFEKQFLGYHWSNPLGMYKVDEYNTIANAKKGNTRTVSAIIDKLYIGETKGGKAYGRLEINDGKLTATVFLWNTDLKKYREILSVGNGIKLNIHYDKERDVFVIDRYGSIIQLSNIDSDEVVEEPEFEADVSEFTEVE